MRLDSTTVRRLIPAGAIVGVLALSYLAQAPSLASNNGVGYGYANNCGVKGYGTHDHGKVCPNRPFPGQGLGVLRILGKSSSGSGVTVTEPPAKAHAKSQIVMSTASQVANSSSANVDDEINFASHHGRGNIHGKAQGHSGGEA